MKKIDLNDESWLYIFLEAVLLIFIDSLYNYYFNVFNTDISFSILLLPFVFYVVNYIYKKYGYKVGIKSIMISILFLLIYNIIMSFALGGVFNIYNIVGDFCSYLISLFIFLKLGEYFQKNFKFSILLLYLRYLFSILIYHVIFIFISLDNIELSDVWLYYLITFFIQIIICVPTLVFDLKLIEKNKN